MIEEKIKRAYSEVYEVLLHIDPKYVKKIPKEVLKKIYDEKLEGYNPKIDMNKKLNEQNFQRKTLVILATLELEYWCENEEEKQELIKIYMENEQKYQAKLSQKYNPNEIFKNKK